MRPNGSGSIVVGVSVVYVHIVVAPDVPDPNKLRHTGGSFGFDIKPVGPTPIMPYPHLLNVASIITVAEFFASAEYGNPRR